MLATLVSEPFHRKGWVYEEKYDGYRILAYKEGPRVTLLSRNAKNRNETFSEVAEAIAGAVRELFLDLIIREDLKHGPLEIPADRAEEPPVVEHAAAE